MCDMIGDIPIQSKERKSWAVGENCGTFGVGGSTAGVVLHIRTSGNKSLNSGHPFSENRML